MPSNSVLEQKKAVVADLVAKMQKAQSGVLVQYQGITVENDTKMRAAFRKAGVDYILPDSSEKENAPGRQNGREFFRVYSPSGKWEMVPKVLV